MTTSRIFVHGFCNHFLILDVVVDRWAFQKWSGIIGTEAGEIVERYEKPVPISIRSFHALSDVKLYLTKIVRPDGQHDDVSREGKKQIQRKVCSARKIKKRGNQFCNVKVPFITRTSENVLPLGNFLNQNSQFNLSILFSHVIHLGIMVRTMIHLACTTWSIQYFFGRSVDMYSYCLHLQYFIARRVKWIKVDSLPEIISSGVQWMGYKYVVLIIKSQMKLDVPKIKTKRQDQCVLIWTRWDKDGEKEKPLLVTHVTKSGVKGLSFELCHHLSFFLLI